MSIMQVAKAGLLAWVDCLTARQRVIGVQADGDRFVFKPLKQASDLRLDYDVTILPPKTYFQPQTETILAFERDKGYETVVDAEPFVLFGVHPYDMIAVSQMDRLFSEGECDIHYTARREKATIVVVDVQNASQDVFAGYMGTSHTETGGDVLLTKIDDNYLVEAHTQAGEALIADLDGSEPGDDALAARKKVWEDNAQALRKHELKADPAQWPALLEKGYDHPIWEEKAEKCFSCGSCNLPCPTCYCFDVHDTVNWDLASGKRVRTWDGCMLADFAAVAGGHNFRSNRAARYRHRYYRKGLYVPAKIDGQIACVGCGRCITACVANIANPVEIFNRLREEEK